MMTNRSGVVLYTGITNSLERRLWFHSNNNSKRSFTKRYKSIDLFIMKALTTRATQSHVRRKSKDGGGKRKTTSCED